jgi:hypothetical protein
MNKPNTTERPLIARGELAACDEKDPLARCVPWQLSPACNPPAVRRAMARVEMLEEQAAAFERAAGSCRDEAELLRELVALARARSARS